MSALVTKTGAQCTLAVKQLLSADLILNCLPFTVIVPRASRASFTTCDVNVTYHSWFRMSGPNASTAALTCMGSSLKAARKSERSYGRPSNGPVKTSEFSLSLVLESPNVTPSILTSCFV